VTGSGRLELLPGSIFRAARGDAGRNTEASTDAQWSTDREIGISVLQRGHGRLEAPCERAQRVAFLDDVLRRQSLAAGHAFAISRFVRPHDGRAACRSSRRLL